MRALLRAHKAALLADWLVLLGGWLLLLLLLVLVLVLLVLVIVVLIRAVALLRLLVVVLRLASSLCVGLAWEISFETLIILLCEVVGGCLGRAVQIALRYLALDFLILNLLLCFQLQFSLDQCKVGLVCLCPGRAWLLLAELLAGHCVRPGVLALAQNIIPLPHLSDVLRQDVAVLPSAAGCLRCLAARDQLRLDHFGRFAVRIILGQKLCFPISVSDLLLMSLRLWRGLRFGLLRGWLDINFLFEVVFLGLHERARKHIL